MRAMDSLSRAARAKLMGRVRQRDTTPEVLLRLELSRLRLRFQVNQTDLPGSPDIVLRKQRVCIFVHGCFWHRHHNCQRTTIPATRREFWMEKFRCNMNRDRRVVRALRRAGWRVFVVWECVAYDASRLRRRAASIAKQIALRPGKNLSRLGAGTSHIARQLPAKGTVGV